MEIPVARSFPGGTLTAATAGSGFMIFLTMLVLMNGAKWWINALMATATMLAILIFFGPVFFLKYRVTPDRLMIWSVSGSRAIKKEDIQSLSVVDFFLGCRRSGTASLAYYVGVFDISMVGQAEVFSGTNQGKGVLIETRQGRKILLSPKDPYEMVDLLESRGTVVVSERWFPTARRLSRGRLALAMMISVGAFFIPAGAWQTGSPRWVTLVMIPPAVFTILSCFGPMFSLKYRVSPQQLVIRTVSGEKVIKAENIRSVSVVDFALGRRRLGVAALAYYVGTFDVSPIGQAEVFTGTDQGRGVLVETWLGQRVIISPDDPEAAVETLDSW